MFFRNTAGHSIFYGGTLRDAKVLWRDTPGRKKTVLQEANFIERTKEKKYFGDTTGHIFDWRDTPGQKRNFGGTLRTQKIFLAG